jgi:hypothetical protein
MPKRTDSLRCMLVLQLAQGDLDRFEDADDEDEGDFEDGDGQEPAAPGS